MISPDWPRRNEPWTYGEDMHMLAMLSADEKRAIAVRSRRADAIARALGRTPCGVLARLQSLRVGLSRLDPKF